MASGKTQAQIALRPTRCFFQNDVDAAGHGLRPIDDDALLDAALVRNLYRGEAPPAAALAHVRGGLRALAAGLAAMPHERLMEGRLA